MPSNIDHSRFPGCSVSDLGVSAPVPHCLGWHTWNVALQTTPKLVSVLSIFSETEDTARAYFARHEPNVEVLAVEMVLPEGFVDEPRFNESTRVDADESAIRKLARLPQLTFSGLAAVLADPKKLALPGPVAATEEDIARTRTTTFRDAAQDDTFTLKPGTLVIRLPGGHPHPDDAPDPDHPQLGAFAADDLIIGSWYWIMGSDGAWYLARAEKPAQSSEVS